MMLIAVENNNVVYVYDCNKKLAFSYQGKLYNYTDNYVAIRRVNNSDCIDIYNCQGCKVATYPYDLVDNNIIGMIF